MPLIKYDVIVPVVDNMLIYSNKLIDTGNYNDSRYMLIIFTREHDCVLQLHQLFSNASNVSQM